MIRRVHPDTTERAQGHQLDAGGEYPLHPW
jgi:hypothetical protein